MAVYEPPYSLYPALVWACCYQAMNWLVRVLNTTTDVDQIDEPTTATFMTLRNGIHAIDAWQLWTALAVEQSQLIAVQALPFGGAAADVQYMNARITAIEQTVVQLASLPPPLTPIRVCQAATALDQGEPVVPDPMFLEWCMNYAVELPVPGSLLPQGAQNMANAWRNICNQINAFLGNTNSTQYDTAARQYRCAQQIATTLSQLQSGPFAATIGPVAGAPLFDSAGNQMLDSAGNPLYTAVATVNRYAWNQVVALPTILLDASVFTSHPASLINQQAAVIKYNLIVQLKQLASLMLALRVHAINLPVTDNLRNSESLADLAARDLGDFEQWPNIANINALTPPYPGPTNQALALSGRSLFLSSQGVTPDPDAQVPTYNNNVLGIDWDFGPFQGPQPAWAGDIPLIAGNLNFSRSLGRRIQTSLGSLIYHRTYGSRIPPEVGAVQTADEAARLKQYGDSAILADPRTNAVLSSVATTQPGFLATYSAVVQPVGPYSSAVATNSVIGARP